MPAADTVLLPICVALSLVGIVVTGVAWRQHRTGRAVQGAALVIAPIALYLSGLLRLVWDFVVSIVAWTGRVVFSPQVWIGLSLLGLAVVLFVVGGLVAKRTAGRRKIERDAGKGTSPTKVTAQTKGSPAVGTGTATTSALAPKAGARPAKGKQVASDDPEMDEIEALLKSRGID